MINEPCLINTLFELVKIDSESRNEANLANVLADKLTSYGFDVIKYPPHPSTGSNCGNLYAFLDGEPDLSPILFCAHMDTVSPGKNIIPAISDEYIFSDSETILGGDDKAGISAILEAAREITENQHKHRPIEILFTVCEELGMLGSKSVDFAHIRSKQAVVVDCSGHAGKIITQAPGQTIITAKIHGLASHAGAEPEKGVSAIMIGADAICNMKLLRVDPQTTANIGVFEAHGATNIVSPEALLIAEARSTDKQKLDAQVENMKSCLISSAEKYGGSVDVEITYSYHAFKLPDDCELVKLISDKCKSLAINPCLATSGGGSDANVFNAAGLTAVNLSNGSESVHSKSERLIISDMVDCSRILFSLMCA